MTNSRNNRWRNWLRRIRIPITILLSPIPAIVLLRIYLEGSNAALEFLEQSMQPIGAIDPGNAGEFIGGIIVVVGPVIAGQTLVQFLRRGNNQQNNTGTKKIIEQYDYIKKQLAHFKSEVSKLNTKLRKHEKNIEELDDDLSEIRFDYEDLPEKSPAASNRVKYAEERLQEEEDKVTSTKQPFEYLQTILQELERRFHRGEIEVDEDEAKKLSIDLHDFQQKLDNSQDAIETLNFEQVKKVIERARNAVKEASSLNGKETNGNISETINLRPEDKLTPDHQDKDISIPTDEHGPSNDAQDPPEYKPGKELGDDRDDPFSPIPTGKTDTKNDLQDPAEREAKNELDDNLVNHYEGDDRDGNQQQGGEQ